MDDKNIPSVVLKINLEAVCHSVHVKGTFSSVEFVLVMINVSLPLQLKCSVCYCTYGNYIFSPEGKSNWCHLLPFTVLKQAVGCKFL